MLKAKRLNKRLIRKSCRAGITLACVVLLPVHLFEPVQGLTLRQRSKKFLINLTWSSWPCWGKSHWSSSCSAPRRCGTLSLFPCTGRRAERRPPPPPSPQIAEPARGGDGRFMWCHSPAQQMDCSDFGYEILLIHLANLQQRAFYIASWAAVDTATNQTTQLPVELQKGDRSKPLLEETILRAGTIYAVKMN